MVRVRDGDDAAFAELVANYQDRLIGVLTHLAPSQEAAEDLAQEVFLRIYRKRKAYEATAKFSTWLFRIANNLASNSRRNWGRKKEVTLTGSDSGPLGAHPEDNLATEKSALMPTRQIDKREMQQIVRTALDSLNDRQRVAVLLNKFEGMSYVDIAAAMELTPEAVKSLLSRARENLRTVLEPYIQGV